MKMPILAKIRFLVACSIWKAKCTQEGTGTDITFTVTGSRNRSHLWIFSYTHKSNILEHCKGLVLHDKVIEGSLYHKQGDETAMAMGIQAFKLLIPVFATAGNPLGRARAILSPLHVLHGWATLHLSLQYLFKLQWMACNHAANRNCQKFNSGMLESFDFLSKGNSKLIKQQSLYDKGMGVVLLHGFGCRVFSWHRVMDTIAREVECHVIAFDQLGWGWTSPPWRSEWES